jgi:hypothetical protein
MIAEIVDRPDGLPDARVEAEPRCGDHCDSCGDCLRCYDWEGCDHRWVVYADLEPDRAAELLAAIPPAGGAGHA